VTRRPVAVLAMMPWAAKHVFSGELRARLEQVVALADGDVLRTFDDERAALALAEAEVLVTCWGTPEVDDAALALAPKLQVIVHAAGTVKDFLGDGCWDRGIRVTSVAAANARPVAEYTLGAIILANKGAFVAQQVYAHTRQMPRPTGAPPIPGNMGKRIGIVGASRVGRGVMELLTPFDLEVVVSDPLLSAEEATTLGAALLPLDELLATADIVSVHAPLLPETTGLLDARRLALIKDGATLINTARGAIIDSAALDAELLRGRICAVIDTTWPEPLPPGSPLFDLPNVFLTPHLAGSQGTELARMAEAAIAELERFVRGEDFAYEIKREDLPWIA
jgi:phosphoglycerate dehydrogenase-like enzyme